MAIVKKIKAGNIITSDADQSTFEALDAGNEKELNIKISVKKQGSAGVIRLQHAAYNREEDYMDLSGTNVNLNATGDTFVQVTAFLRFIRWRVDNSVAGAPVATIDIVGKD